MKHEYLQNFRSLDSASFAALLRHLGFAAAACYRLSGEALVQVLRAGDEVEWPAAVGYSIHYTPIAGQNVPLGWLSPRTVPTLRNLWPKGVSLYFPEQELYGEKVLLAVLVPPGMRLKPGELSGPLEAACARIRSWYDDQAGRQRISETGLEEHKRTLGLDLQMLIDHELRTPLASVAGYAALLRDLDPRAQPEAWSEYWQVMDAATTSALEAVEKMSLALHSRGGEAEPQEAGPFDAAEAVRRLCAEAKERAAELVGVEAAARVSVRFQKNTDQSCAVSGSPRLFRWAVWEVLKNALIHAKSGKVEVRVYTSDKSLVIDVEDDGSGVSPGSEELIFLRFYQDPGTQHLRRGKRGLGLGLFLARHIVERHMGQLTFIRQRGSSLFRFVWPRSKDGGGEVHFPKGA